jgi:hypothetical protein
MLGPDGVSDFAALHSGRHNEWGAALCDGEDQRQLPHPRRIRRRVRGGRNRPKRGARGHGLGRCYVAGLDPIWPRADPRTDIGGISRTVGNRAVSP